MGLLNKKPDKPKDTITRILEGSSVQPIEIIQTKTKHKYMPWVTAQKELKFKFPPPDPSPPVYTPKSKDKPRVQVTETSRDLEKAEVAEESAEQGLSLTQVAQVGAIVSGALVGLNWAKRAYDTYYTAEKKT